MHALSRITVVVFALVASVAPYSANAVPILHSIEFTQTFFHPNFGPRNLTGSFIVDDSILGPSFANQSYGISLASSPSLTDFTVSLGSTTYLFDSAFTAAIGLPPITVVLTLGSAGEVIDVQGGLTIAGSHSQIILGREGTEGTYVDVQQIDRNSSFPVSRGTYSIRRITPIPEPAPIPEPSTLALLGLGLAGMRLAIRRQV